jgi:hypothetical protein
MSRWAMIRQREAMSRIAISAVVGKHFGLM